MGLILEAQCDVTAELGRFELADDTLDESRAFAARAQLEALPSMPIVSRAGRPLPGKSWETLSGS